MKRAYFVLSLIALSIVLYYGQPWKMKPVSLEAADVASVMGVADSAIMQTTTGIMGVPGNDISTIAGVNYNDGDEAPSAHCDDATHDGDGNAILLCEDFDGSSDCGNDAGNDQNCRCTTWIVSGTGSAVDFNDTSSPAPLEATYSATVTNSGGSGNKTYITSAVSATGEVWAYAIVNLQTVAVGQYDVGAVFYFRDSADSDIATFQVTNTGGTTYRWYVYGGGTPGTASTGPTAGTTYHIWMYYKKGTGSNAVLTLWVSTDATKPGSATCTSTTGTGTTDVSKVAMMARGTYLPDNIFDHVRVSASEIGSNPP